MPACVACGGSFEGKSTQARAAHLAGCNAAAEPSRARGAARLPTYHTPHRVAVSALREICEEADIVATEEQWGHIAGTRERPGDVTAYVQAYIGTHAVAVDVVITHLLTATERTTAARHPGQPVLAAEGVKRTRYEGRLTPGTRFVPFAMDDFGHLGDAAMAFLDQLAAHAAARRTSDFRHGKSFADRRAYWLARWQERLAWIVHLGIDQSMHRRLELSRNLARSGKF